MRIKKGFALRNICGENVIQAEGKETINFSKLVTLNDSAAYLWQNLQDKEFTEEDMAQLLVDMYEIDKATALRDSAALWQTWKEIGLVEE